MSSLRPGKPSRHILGAKTVQEIRGGSTILQYLANSYNTNSISDKKSGCFVCKEEGARDTPGHLWICKRATIAKSLRNELLEELPLGHPASLLEVSSVQLTRFILDPESKLLNQYQLQERPANFERILSLCRLTAHFSHQSRYRIARTLKRDHKPWKEKETMDPGSQAAKRRTNPRSFLDL